MKIYTNEALMAREDLLIPFNKMDSYKLAFSCREWIYAYLSTYKPACCYYFSNDINYTAICEVSNEATFIGAGFNDYNTFNVVSQDDPLEVEYILSYFKKVNKNVSFTCLHESHYIKHLAKISGNFRWLPSVSINLTSEILFHSKAYIKYKKIRDRLLFKRTYISEKEDFADKLEKLLDQRILNLNEHNCIHPNSSMGVQFNEFIKEFCSNMTANQASLFIDSLQFDEQLVAMGLSVRKKNSVIYYLRSTKYISNKYSFGLYLDCLAIERNKDDSVEIMDFGRGDESYKYRLGGVTYNLANFKS